MADVGIVIDQGGERLAERLDRLADMPIDNLMDNIGSEIKDQTVRRIESEKTDPEGNDWEDWSPKYAATRHGNQSLLIGGGPDYLLTTITWNANSESVIVGTNLIYGAIHQFGGEEVDIPIPARPYLGLSDENEEDVMGIVDKWLDDQIAEATDV